MALMKPLTRARDVVIEAFKNSGEVSVEYTPGDDDAHFAMDYKTDGDPLVDVVAEAIKLISAPTPQAIIDAHSGLIGALKRCGVPDAELMR